MTSSTLAVDNFRFNKYIPFIIIFFVYLILSFLRYPFADDSYYLLETSNMARILSEGSWIGNDAVGLHGFLFKLPIALLFTLLGPSVFIANLFHVILAALSCYLFFLILNKHFKDDSLALVGIIILASGYHFLLASTTFVREIPVLFSFLLFLFLILNKKNKLYVGLSLLLIIDAKEHVFFQIMPGFIIWVIYINYFKSKNDRLFQKAQNFFYDCIQYFVPVIFYLILMFFTSIVPINMFVAYILGLIDHGFNPMAKKFVSGSSYLGTKGSDIFKESLVFKLFGHQSYSYFTKILYPRVVSFISIPKIIVIPALISSWDSLFKKDKCLKEDNVLFFLLFWSFFLIFYFQVSHGRYLFAIIPLIIIFYLKFLKDLCMNKKSFLILSVTVFTIIGGLFFEFNYLMIKIFLNATLISFIVFLIINNEKNFISKKQTILLVFGILIGLFTFGTALAASITLRGGQLKHFLIHGYCDELYEVVRNIDSDSRIYVNNKFIKFYRMEKIASPEYKWRLKKWIPKKQMLKKYNKFNTYDISFNKIQDLKDELFTHNIEWVYMYKSTVDEISFNNQNITERLMKVNFLKLEKSLTLKNKKVYIFRVIRKRSNKL